MGIGHLAIQKDRQTDTTENITFPQLRWREVNKEDAVEFIWRSHFERSEWYCQLKSHISIVRRRRQTNCFGKLKLMKTFTDLSRGYQRTSKLNRNEIIMGF